LVSKAEVLGGDWKLLRIEISEHEDHDGVEALDGYSRFWCKEAVLGAYWMAEKVEETKIRLHLTEEIELVGFKEALSFEPDTAFKRELLSLCDWEEVVRQIFPVDEARQLSLFEGADDE
jgi:hypothetical protein